MKTHFSVTIRKDLKGKPVIDIDDGENSVSISGDELPALIEKLREVNREIVTDAWLELIQAHRDKR